MKFIFPKLCRFIIYAIVLMSFNVTGLIAQNGLEVGGWVGSMNYFGDLNTSLTWKHLTPAIGAELRYNFNDRISAKTGLAYGKIKAFDKNSTNFFEKNRNLSFKSDIIEWSSQIEFGFYPFLYSKKDYAFSPYIFASLGVTHFNPTAQRLDEGTGKTRVFNLQSLGTEGQKWGQEYGKFSPIFGLGMGFRKKIGFEWSINVEFAYRFTRSDYLDDVSGNYPDFAKLQSQRGADAVYFSGKDLALSPNIAVEGQQRGNKKDKDQYAIIKIGVMRYFGRLDCPKIK